MIIELIPNKSEHSVTLKCEEDGYTTKTTMSNQLSIGIAMRVAIESHYKQVAQERINRLLGGN